MSTDRSKLSVRFALSKGLPSYIYYAFAQHAVFSQCNLDAKCPSVLVGMRSKILSDSECESDWVESPATECWMNELHESLFPLFGLRSPHANNATLLRFLLEVSRSRKPNRVFITALQKTVNDMCPVRFFLLRSNNCTTCHKFIFAPTYSLTVGRVFLFHIQFSILDISCIVSLWSIGRCQHWGVWISHKTKRGKDKSPCLAMLRC